ATRIARRLTEIEVLSRDEPFAFAHPVLRRSVYDRLTLTDREAAHSRAADVLRAAGAGPEAIAAHVAALGPSGSSTAATVLAESARHAMSRAAPDAAARLLRRALAEQAPEPPRADLLFELGQAETAVRDPAAIAHLQEALGLAADPHQRGRIAIALSDLLVAAGQWGPALEVVATAIPEMEARAPELLAELESFRAVGMAYDARLVHEFDRERERFDELSRGDGWAAKALAALLASIGSVRGESTASVTEKLDRALSGGRLIAERGAGAWAAAQVLCALVCTESYDRALAVSEQVAAEGRRTGALRGVITGVGYPGMVYDRTGDLAAAEAVLLTVVNVAEQSGMVLWLVTVFQGFCDTLAERPHLAHVARLMDGVEVDPVLASTATGAMLLEARGRVALARMDRVRAREDLLACAPTYEALGLGPMYSPWRSELALALTPAERDQAQSLVAEELELGRASGFGRAEGVALRTAGILDGGERAVELLRDSVAKLEASPARLEHARSQVELGAALRRRQQRSEAIEHLSAGMEQADRCGADRLVARAREELHAAGARPRRTARSGIDSLTASELRVARRAAMGRSNREIAQELFVTGKTVETHLSSAYSKLGLAGKGSRGRLAEVLEAPPSPQG
ncbi:MAG TPA: LuxR C-terminal-related transcriptional regulator, partial [Solirubrobacteraceae bacterium]